MIRPILIAAAAALTFMSFAAPASAHTSDQSSAQRVSFQGIDASTPAGAELMLGRIRAAAAYVCDDRRGVRQLWQKMQTRQCMRRTVDNAVERLHNPMLTATYEGRDETFTLASR